MTSATTVLCLTATPRTGVVGQENSALRTSGRWRATHRRARRVKRESCRCRELSCRFSRCRLAGAERATVYLQRCVSVLFFAMSTAVLFAIMSQLIANRVHIETRYRSEAAGSRAP